MSKDELPAILAVDFDGTIVEDKYPLIGEPIIAVVNFLQDVRASGVKLILWTCRNGSALIEAVKFCSDLGIEFDAVNKNLPEVQQLYGGDTRKVFADYYLDDKALTMEQITTYSEICKNLADTYYREEIEEKVNGF